MHAYSCMPVCIQQYIPTLLSLKISTSISVPLLFPKASNVFSSATSSSPGWTVNSCKMETGGGGGGGGGHGVISFSYC